MNRLAGGSFVMQKMTIFRLTDCRLKTPRQQTVVFATDETVMVKTERQFQKNVLSKNPSAVFITWAICQVAGRSFLVANAYF